MVWVWPVLKVLLLVLLILLLVLVCLLLLVLFLPIGYAIDMRKAEEDPEGSAEEPVPGGGMPSDVSDVKQAKGVQGSEDPAYSVHVRAGWLFDAVRFRGAFDDKEGLRYQAKALWKVLREKKPKGNERKAGGTAR